MLVNPYNPDGYKDDLQKIAGRVSPEDYSYLRKLFPCGTGMQDKIVSILFKKLIDELRRLELDPATDAAWSVFHPNYLLLHRLLDGCNFGNIERPRDDGDSVPLPD